MHQERSVVVSIYIYTQYVDFVCWCGSLITKPEPITTRQQGIYCMDAVNDTNRTARLPFYNFSNGGWQVHVVVCFWHGETYFQLPIVVHTQDDVVQGSPSMGYTGNSGLRSIGSNSRTGGGVLNGLAGLQWHQPNQIFRSAKPNFHQKYRIWNRIPIYNIYIIISTSMAGWPNSSTTTIYMKGVYTTRMALSF